MKPEIRQLAEIFRSGHVSTLLEISQNVNQRKCHRDPEVLSVRRPKINVENTSPRRKLVLRDSDKVHTNAPHKDKVFSDIRKKTTLQTDRHTPLVVDRTIPG